MTAETHAKLQIPDLAGKAVLITGASTGIGAALARAFAAQGSMVAINYHSSETAARSLLGEIEQAGGRALLVKGDVTKPEDCARIVAETAERFERLDALNVKSVISVTRAARPWLARQGGFVVNTTSIAARNGGGGGAVLYAAAKGFVSTITKGHAKELIGDKIRVNGVAPGVIATPFHERYSDDQTMEAMRRTVPMGRLGTAEDCVGAYLFLASEALSGYVIGQIIEVNGGQLMP
jgi:3-oxoacyl-[acyl-carrier protein] reductase